MTKSFVSTIVLFLASLLSVLHSSSRLQNSLPTPSPTSSTATSTSDDQTDAQSPAVSIPQEPWVALNSAKDTYYLLRNGVVYYWPTNSAVVGADPSSFQVLALRGEGQFVGRDKNAVYEAGTKIGDADPTSFFLYDNSGYAADASHVFYLFYADHPAAIAGADPLTFSVVQRTDCGPNCQFDAHDVNHSYLAGEIVQ